MQGLDEWLQALAVHMYHSGATPHSIHILSHSLTVYGRLIGHFTSLGLLRIRAPRS